MNTIHDNQKIIDEELKKAKAREEKIDEELKQIEENKKEEIQPDPQPQPEKADE